MTNLDTLLTESRAKFFNSYSIIFGSYRLANGEKKANIIVDAYHTRMQVEQKRFEGETLTECIEQLKAWLAVPSDEYQMKSLAAEVKPEVKEPQQMNLFNQK